MLALDIIMMSGYVPYDTVKNAPLVFMHFRFHDAPLWWNRFAFVYAAWTAAFIGCIVVASAVARTLGKRFVPAILAVQAAMLCLMMASPLPLDSDQYAYVYYASLTQRGVNPYGHYTRPLQHLTPTERRIAAHWDNPPYIDRYGSGWTLANAAFLYPFRGLSAEAQARLLRIAAAIAALLCTMLFALALRDVPWRPAALVAFALNPLVILETGNGGHNDIFLLLLGLCAFILGTRRYYEWAAFGLAAAVCTKFAYAPLILPLMAYAYATSRSLVRVAATLAVFVGTIFAFAVPLTIKLSLVDVAFGFNSSHQPLYSYFLWRLAYHLGLHGSTQSQFAVLFPLFTAVCAVAVAWYALNNRRQPNWELALLLSILLVPYKIEGWYCIMLAPMVLIRRPWAVAAYAGVTAACEFMERRIFFPYDHPYIICLFLGLAVGAGVWQLMQRPLRTNLETPLLEVA